MKVIAICGYKRSGKDSIANFLVATYGYTPLKIAEGLKSMIKTMFDFTDDQLEVTKDIIDERWGITPRRAMQFFGTEIMQQEVQKLLPDVGRSFWMRKITNTLANASDNEKFVISDMRFYHEYEALKDFYPYIIKVTNPNVKCVDTHCSETEFATIPHHIEVINDGTLEALYEKITHIINQS
jgi:hypothetical protein